MTPNRGKQTRSLQILSQWTSTIRIASTYVSLDAFGNVFSACLVYSCCMLTLFRWCPSDTPSAAWYPHPPQNVSRGEVLLAFPSVFSHKMFADHHENDGLVDVRLLSTRNGSRTAVYSNASNGRWPVIPLGKSGCIQHLRPAIYPPGEMWCNSSAELANAAFDSGKIWAASGLIESADGSTVSLFYGGNPASHGRECHHHHQPQ